jgi:hypothetical protein
LGEVQVELEGERMPILVLFGSEDAPPLIGAHALEAFLRVVDAIDKMLVRCEAFLMSGCGSCGRAGGRARHAAPPGRRALAAQDSSPSLAETTQRSWYQSHTSSGTETASAGGLSSVMEMSLAG